MSCFKPTKDCSTELASATCLRAAAFSPTKRSSRSLTASPWEGQRSGHSLSCQTSPVTRAPSPRVLAVTVRRGS